jgi:hypothetical protein
MGGFDRSALRAYSRIEREAGMWVVYLDVLFTDGVARRRIAAYASRAQAEMSAKWMQRVADRDLDGPPSGY